MGDSEQSLTFRDPLLENTKIAVERDRTLPIVTLDQTISESVKQGARLPRAASYSLVALARRMISANSWRQG